MIRISLATVVGEPDRLDVTVCSQREPVRLDDRDLEGANDLANGSQNYDQRFGRVKGDDLALGREGRTVVRPAAGYGIG